MVSYSELFQLLTLIVAVVALVMNACNRKNEPPYSTKVRRLVNLSPLN